MRYIAIYSFKKTTWFKDNGFCNRHSSVLLSDFLEITFTKKKMYIIFKESLYLFKGIKKKT